MGQNLVRGLRRFEYGALGEPYTRLYTYLSEIQIILHETTAAASLEVNSKSHNIRPNIIYGGEPGHKNNLGM